MKRLSRRSFFAAAAVPFMPWSWWLSTSRAEPVTAVPAPTTADADVIIVGAGSAGIAAARRLESLGLRFILLEASDHLGGRCVTDLKSFGVPFDRGAHWLHMPELNPLYKLAPETGLEVYPAPRHHRLRIGTRDASPAELKSYLAALARANRAIAMAARGGTDISCAQALQKDLGPWRKAVDFMLGPFGCGKDLAEISASDFAHSAERDIDAFCRQGYGTLLAELARHLPIKLETPVTHIEWSGRGVEVETPKGRLRGSAAIVTVSTNLLIAEVIKFLPALPHRYLDAAAKLQLGSYDHVALELRGNPLGLRTDEVVLEKPQGPHAASILANVAGNPLCVIDLASSLGRELSARGEAEMLDFTREWLGGLYGTNVKRAVASSRSQVTRWNHDPWVRGAFSAAAPGGQPSRRALMEPLADRIYFAGEAAHETLWGTVGGAWESGERAAAAVHRHLDRNAYKSSGQAAE